MDEVNFFPETSINLNQITFHHNLGDSNFHTHISESYKSRTTLCSQADKNRRLEETSIPRPSGFTMKIEREQVSPTRLYLHNITH